MVANWTVKLTDVATAVCAKRQRTSPLPESEDIFDAKVQLYLGHIVLFAHKQGSQCDCVQQQGRSPISEHEGRRVYNGEFWDKLSKEQMKAAIEENAGES